jgi:hypothetical protein
VYAQSPIDALNLSQTEMRGSARFMSMAGAFTALGADLSAINQNPAGIAMYRGSDIGLSIGVDINSNNTQWESGSESESNTVANLNNAGYVGTTLFGNDNENSFSWGFTYNRLYRYDRMHTGGLSNMQTSLTNYIASETNGVDPQYLWSNNGGIELSPYDNYSADAPDWMSVLFYNSGMINPETYQENGDVYETDQYRGLWHFGGTDYLGNKINPSSGSANFTVREKGHADEYNITLGGSIMNLVYIGMGVGITDMDYSQEYYYSEKIDNSLIPAYPAGYSNGTTNAADLYAYHKVSGTGANFKIGAIIKPINELRIGLAVHTPTYYMLDSSSYGETYFNFSSANDDSYRFSGSESTPRDSYSFKFNTPWKVMAGIAGVIGGRAIVSLDYQYDAYGDMKLKDDTGYELTRVNDNIKRYFQGTNTIRIGAEYRVTPAFSVRAGYSNVSSSAGKEYKDANNFSTTGSLKVSTAGFNTSYTVNNATDYITCGLGYKASGFYVDLAYVYKHQTSTFNAFTPFVDYDGNWSAAPTAKLTDNKSQIVATFGYRF